MNQKHLLILIFLLSIIFSSVFLLFFRNVGPTEHKIPGTDYSSCYLPAAQDILKGNFVFQSNGFIRCAIGYPLVILPAILFSKIFGFNALDIIPIYNVFITAFSACFLFLFIKSMFDKKIALLSSFLWMSYPLNLWFIKNPNTEVPFMLFLFIEMWIFMLAIRNKKIWLFFLSGVVLGFSVLVRPIAIFLILFLLIPTFILSSKGKKIISYLILVIGFLIIIAPWMLAASLATGHFVLVSSIGQVTFLDGLSFGIKEGPHGNRVSVPEGVKSVIEDAQKEKFNNEISIPLFFLKEFAKKPLSVFELFILKSVRSWYGTSQLWLEKEIFIIQLPYLLSAIAGLFLIFKKYREKINIAVSILLIILYFWLMTIIGPSIARYMVPIIAFVVVFSAIAVNSILERLKIWNKLFL
jgi:4-amino-4-deoxy-L-arabinose transferase-like glycosyltransferase